MTLTPGQYFVLECFAAVALFAVGYGALWFGAAMGWYSEIENFPSSVLKHHYPTVENRGDMTKFKEWPDGPGTIDLLVGGTPCQSFSIAGLRKGLDDPRGNLMLTYLALADKYRPQWLVWENVPGVLSSEGGRDFGTFLGGLGELGYGFSYRVLDAQYFGVPQRRRRVFVVGYLGDWRPAAAVLFERHSLQGNNPPSRTPGERIAASLAQSAKGSGGIGMSNQELFSQGGANLVRPDDLTFRMKGFGDYSASASASALKQRDSKDATDLIVEPVPLDLRNATRDPDKKDAQNRQGAGVGNPGDPSPTLSTAFVPGVVDFEPGIASREGGHVYNDISGTIRAEPGDNQMTVIVPQVHDMRGNGDGQIVPTLTGDHASRPTDYTPVISFAPANLTRGKGQPSEDVAATLRAESKGGDQVPHVAVPAHTFKMRGGKEGGEKGYLGSDEKAFTVSTGQDQNLFTGMSVRRLTPRECERLQGFPDDYTLVPYRGKPAADGPRYKAIGNSMAVPVMAWIGQRIQEVRELMAAGK